MAQCSKKTANGKRCKAAAIAGKKTCVFHTGKTAKSTKKTSTKKRGGGRRFRA